jgi:hypothetical protein
MSFSKHHSNYISIINFSLCIIAYCRSTLVATIQSHVGTEHNDEAWLMLSVIAENKPLTSPSFAFNHIHERLSDIDKVSNNTEYNCNGSGFVK